MEFATILSYLESIFSESLHSPPSPPQVKKKTPFNVLLISPHPDDECLSSALALRLQQENSAQIFNAAVTLGSKKSRQKERLYELEKACEELNIKNFHLTSEYFGEDHSSDTQSWKSKESILEKLILEIQPRLIIAPHHQDGHPTHIKTSNLLLKVLQNSEDIRHQNLEFMIAWSEYWFPMKDPNILVSVSLDILIKQINALKKHEGEISRNPYHLRLPAWMMDNVRRGCEILAKPNQHHPISHIPFGVLYRLNQCKKGKIKTFQPDEPILTEEKDLSHLLTQFS